MAADDMEQVVDKVQERWLGSLDKEEPEIADEFYHKMRDAIREIHATEGFVNVKVAKARLEIKNTKFSGFSLNMHVNIRFP